MQCSNGNRDIVNRLVDTVWEGEDGINWEQLAHFEGWEGEDHQSHLYSFAFIILISKESIMYNSCGPKGLTEHLPVRGGCHKHLCVKYFCGCKFSFLLGKYQGAWLLNHMVF